MLGIVPDTLWMLPTLVQLKCWCKPQGFVQFSFQESEDNKFMLGHYLVLSTCQINIF